MSDGTNSGFCFTNKETAGEGGIGTAREFSAVFSYHGRAVIIKITTVRVKAICTQNAKDREINYCAYYIDIATETEQR